MHVLPLLSIRLALSGYISSMALLPTTIAVEKRADNPATFRLAALSEYQKTANGAPTPTGDDVMLYPTADGSEFLMGPDVRKGVDDTYKTECGNPSGSKCLEAIIEVLRGDDDGLAKDAGKRSLFNRQVDPIGAAAVLAGSVIASAASELVFKTADNDVSPMSAKVTPTATKAGSGPLKSFEADKDGHHKGYIEFEAPTKQVANAINDIFKKAECKASRRKRGASILKRVDNNIIDCLMRGTTNIIDAMRTGQPLQCLAETARNALQNIPLPNFHDQQYAAAYGQALVANAEAVPRIFNGIPQNQIVMTITFAYLLSAANVQHRLMEESKIVLADEALAKFEEDFKPVCPEKGSPNFPKCDSSICQGKDGKCTVSPMKPCDCGGNKFNCPKGKDKPVCSKCEGRKGKCTTGEHKDSRCINDKLKQFYYYENPRDWRKTVHQIYIELGENKADSKGSGGSPQCDKNKPSKLQNRVFNDGKGNTLYKKFCDAVNKNAREEKNQVVDAKGNEVSSPPHRRKRSFPLLDKRTPPPDLDSSLWNGYSFNLDWAGGDGSCHSECAEFFSTMVSSPCGRLGGEQNYMALEASIDTGCGKYSYRINAPPEPGPIVCHANTYREHPDEPPDEKKNPEKKYRDKKCWNDIHGDSVKRCIKDIGGKIPNGNNNGGHVVDKSMKNATNFLREGGGKKGVTYMANIGWIPGCTDFKTMVADNPQGKSGDPADVSISCTDIIQGTYDKCNNDGLGGYQDYGCLRYGFYPSNYHDMYTTGDPSLYFNANGPDAICKG